MADLQHPSPAKRKLPFKRTARRKSTEVVDDDGLSLFSRSGEFFEEQQRLAKEKVEKEKAARAAKEQREREDRLIRERKAEQDTLTKEPTYDLGSPQKRRRISLPDEEEGKNSDDDDIFSYKPIKKRKSPSVPFTPDSKRESPYVTGTKGSEESRRHSTRSQSVNVSAPVISLDDDDDDDDPTFMSSPTRRPLLQHPHEETDQDVVTLDDENDPQAEVTKGQKEDEEEDPSEYYVRIAMERAQKAKEEREAREKGDSGSKGNEDDPVVQILIHPHLAGVHTLMFRRKLSQKLTVVYQTWIEQQVAKHSLIPRSVLDTMFFTWRGNKVYPHTTLQTLGIKPERDGTLYPSWKEDQEGYHGRDKVFFEAWTQELYDEYLEEKEKQRLRDLGELTDEEPEEKQEPEQSQTSQGDQKIRVLFKAKDQQHTRATVRSSTTAAQLVKVYRRLANIPESKTIELHWDGEALDSDTTVGEADIVDMDSLEVHIK
ncbi:hypothetical protein F4813DRAFT_324791 [Daldinia decipiens]|uniref:uncharacterized protein n=1 Tax=Daldinia decipiens TaxID=326647 RepID=UPI0020C3FF64|nr:uncharacterized protein F4813DRAFT_324791 [Daldinia decipiens]KAI1659792.1 hypothetical protein F4813DRAFT_324791 [Daldinia decipiens]